MAGFILIMVLMGFLTRSYNLFRSMTSLHLALFAMMALATPDLMTQFYTGTLLAIVVPACTLMLFACFRAPGNNRLIFLIFLLLSFFTATQYCFAFFIPLFLVGMMQMQIFGGRSLTAAILGIITPWWLMIGTGAVDIRSLQWPHLMGIFDLIAGPEAYLMLITVALTAFAALLTYVLNFFKTIAYNAHARATNGFVILLTLLTIVAMCIDFGNITSYVLLLDFCSALLVAHYFSVHRADRSFIPIFVLMAVYAAIFICQIII